ncbi:hypothetical protein WJ80_13410 [Burkholderia ubonensis]|nr:hypothetical protein WJ80_13410 [Burkholderia ubonensis]
MLFCVRESLRRTVTFQFQLVSTQLVCLNFIELRQSYLEFTRTLALTSQIAFCLTGALIGLCQSGFDISFAMQYFLCCSIADLLKLSFQCLLGGTEMSHCSLDNLQPQKFLGSVRDICLFVA